MPPDARDPTVGDVVDRRYLLRREIDRGGVGAVFEAEHLVTGRGVAVKLLIAEHRFSKESRARLLREARAMSIARHPRVVAVLDAGQTTDDVPYLVMELIEGRTLSGMLAARRRLPLRDAVQIAIQLCDALAHAHDRGVVHRDLKPHNVFLARSEVGDETAKLFDFGIAMVRGDRPEAAPTGAPADAKLTERGIAMGTAEYMAPEQILARSDVDHRCDLYATGVTLYECLTGTVPFEGTHGEILYKALSHAAPPLRQGCPEAGADLEAAVGRALAKDPNQRWKSARDMARALIATIDRPQESSTLLGLRASQAIAPAPAASPPAAPARRPTSRRRFPRAPYLTLVRIFQADGQMLDGRSEDISEGGLLVLTGRPCKQEELVRVRFALPASGAMVEAEAVARWMRVQRGTGAVGLEFRALPDDAREEIRRYVQIMGVEL